MLVESLDECGCKSTICKPRPEPKCDKCCTLICSGIDKDNNCPIFECECPGECPENQDRQVIKDGECPVIQCCERATTTTSTTTTTTTTTTCLCIEKETGKSYTDNEEWTRVITDKSGENTCTTRKCVTDVNVCGIKTVSETSCEPTTLKPGKGEYLVKHEPAEGKCCPTYEIVC
jgi:hypothetical protein